MIILMRFLAYAAVLMAGLSASAMAQPESKTLGTFGDWEAFIHVEAGKPVCYMVTKASKSDGTYKARGEVLLTVTHRPARKTMDVISIVAGYQYKVDSDVGVTVDKQAWNFFSSADRAWARDPATDKAVAQAIVKGSTLTSKGTSIRGTPTTDTFALAGATKAYKAISDACKAPAK